MFSFHNRNVPLPVTTTDSCHRKMLQTSPLIITKFKWIKLNSLKAYIRTTLHGYVTHLDPGAHHCPIAWTTFLAIVVFLWLFVFDLWANTCQTDHVTYTTWTFNLGGHHHHHHHKCLVPGLQRTGSAWQYKSQYNKNRKLMARIKMLKSVSWDDAYGHGACGWRDLLFKLNVTPR